MTKLFNGQMDESADLTRSAQWTAKCVYILLLVTASSAMGAMMLPAFQVRQNIDYSRISSSSLSSIHNSAKTTLYNILHSSIAIVSTDT